MGSKYTQFAFVLLSTCLMVCATQVNGQQLSRSALLVTVHSRNDDVVSLDPSEIVLKVADSKVSILSVQHLGRTPIEYCVVFDASNSAKHHIDQEKAEARAVLSSVIKSGADHGALVAFQGSKFLHLKGDDANALSGVIQSEKPQGETLVFDAVETCAESFGQLSSVSTSRLMFVFSDGLHDASRLRSGDVLVKLIANGWRVYVFNCDTGFPYGPLNSLASASGGAVYFPLKPDQVGKAVQMIRADIDNRYLISFYLPNAIPTGAKISAMVARKELVLQAPHFFFPLR